MNRLMFRARRLGTNGPHAIGRFLAAMLREYARPYTAEDRSRRRWD